MSPYSWIRIHGKPGVCYFCACLGKEKLKRRSIVSSPGEVFGAVANGRDGRGWWVIHNVNSFKMRVKRDQDTGLLARTSPLHIAKEVKLGDAGHFVLPGFADAVSHIWYIGSASHCLVQIICIREQDPWSKVLVEKRRYGSSRIVIRPQRKQGHLAIWMIRMSRDVGTHSQVAWFVQITLSWLD